MCSTRGRPLNRSRTIACTSVVHSSARRTSPTRSHDESIEQKLFPTTLMSCTSPAAIAASAASSRSNPSCTRPCVTSVRPLSASAAHLQRAVVELGRDRERAFGTGQEFVDVRALACHERELEVTPLRARSYLFEQQARALHPAVAGRGVAEGVRMQLGEVDRDPRSRAEFTGVAQTRERVLPLLARFGEPVVHVRDGAEQDVGERRVFELDRGRELREARFRRRPPRARSPLPREGPSPRSRPRIGRRADDAEHQVRARRGDRQDVGGRRRLGGQYLRASSNGLINPTWLPSGSTRTA